MKLFILKTLICLSFICANTHISNCQSKDSIKIRKNFIGLNLPGITIGAISPAIGYERSISYKKSIGGDLTFYFAPGSSVWGMMLRPEFRYYFKMDSTKRNKGWYVGAQTFYRVFMNSNDKDFSRYVNSHAIGANVVGGYQWVFKKGLFFNLGAGWGPPRLVYSVRSNREGWNDISSYNALSWLLGFELFIRLGYSF